MSEVNRPEAGFAVTIWTAGHSMQSAEAHELAHALQDLYDIATNSLDFGSGFLSAEEVEHLRMIGRAIGAEPLHYKCSYFKGGYSVTRPGGPLQSIWIEPRPCTCGALEEPQP